MLKDLALKWAKQDSEQYPGVFRDKDLHFLFQQCQCGFAELTELLKKREEMLENWVAKSEAFNETNQKRKQNSNPDAGRKKTNEYKFKCSIKSCGKVMNSEPSYNAHMKKHCDRKAKKNEIPEDINAQQS